MLGLSCPPGLEKEQNAGERDIKQWESVGLIWLSNVALVMKHFSSSTSCWSIIFFSFRKKYSNVSCVCYKQRAMASWKV